MASQLALQPMALKRRRLSKLAVIVLGITTSLLIANTSFGNSYQFYGVAKDPDSGEVLYRETHTLEYDASGALRTEQVDYYAPNDALLGQKSLSYNSLQAPNYRSQFFSSNRFEQVETFKDQINIIARKSHSVNLPQEPHVIDAGFHYFLQQNLGRLSRRESIDFLFLAPGRGDFIPMVATAKALEANELSVRLTIKNWLVSRLVKPIELRYDLNTGQLLAYQGLTNIPSANGRFYSAQIEYDYPMADF